MFGNNQSAVHTSREREQLKTFRDKKLLAMVRAGAGMAYLVAAPVSALGSRDRLVPTFSTFSTSWILNGLSDGEVPGITLARRGQRQQTRHFVTRNHRRLWLVCHHDCHHSGHHFFISGKLFLRANFTLIIKCKFPCRIASEHSGGGEVVMFEVGWNLVSRAIVWQFRFIDECVSSKKRSLK